MEEKHKRSVRGSTFLAFGMHLLGWTVLLGATRQVELNSERAYQEAVFNNNEMIIRVNAAHENSIRNRNEISRLGGIVRGKVVADVPVNVDPSGSQSLDVSSTTPDN